MVSSGVLGNGVDRRANGLATLYKGKLQPLDRKYDQTGVGQTCPLVRRLESFGKLEGLVVGPWGRVVRTSIIWSRL